MKRRLLLKEIGHSFSSLRHANFKRFIIGQSISLMGTWIQNIAQPWLVLEITGSPVLLGVVVAAQTLPQMLFTFFAGSLIDHLPKKRILLFTQSSYMLLAIALSLLVYTGWIEFWHVLAIALLFGLMNSIDMPARQAYMIELVGREDLTNAIGINSTIFNLARIVGPGVGGILIASFGIAACFLINGLTYLAVIYQLIRISTPFKITVTEKINLQLLISDIKAGVRYVIKNKTMSYIFTLFLVLGIFAFNFSVLNPVLAKTDFHMGAYGLSIIMTSMGAGALIGALSVIFLKPRKPVLSTILMLSAGFSISQIFLGLSPSFMIACFFMACTGLFMVLFSTMVNTKVQIDTDDAYRGRVVSFYVFVFVGLAPIGSLYAGSFASLLGAKSTYLISGTIALLATLIIWYKTNQLSDLYRSCKKIGKLMWCAINDEDTWRNNENQPKNSDKSLQNEPSRH
jgi:MFS family permease